MIQFMRQALDQARRGEGLTMPNPPVGAVLVRNGAVVGQGYHKRAGGPHAEIHALKSAGRCATGADLYVTLEPCSTTGRTGPCTEAIIKNRVKRVVIATRDPNPKHNGKGIAILQKAGIDVVENTCHDEAVELIRPFSKWITSRRPFVTLKLGMSLDGRIGDFRGRSRWITSSESRLAVMTLRRRSDAILVGAGTASADNPSLLCDREIEPLRVIVDSRGALSLGAKVLNDDFADRTIIATTSGCPKSKCDAYRKKGVMVLNLPAADGRVSIKALMIRLGRMGVLRVLCEGGGEIAHSLIRNKLVDEFVFFIAPMVIGGGKSVPAVGGRGWQLRSCPRIKFTKHVGSGDDIMIHAVPV